MAKHPVQIQRDEHDDSALAKRVVSATTIYAVVNTGAAGQSSVVLDAGTEWVGLATVTVGNELSALATVVEATDKTLIYAPIAGNASGPATIFVPTNTFNVTNIILSANATVGVNIKAGATYLTGNASISMTLFPGGGFVESGDLLNPLYNGMADGASFVVETDDTVDIAGKVVYFEV